MRYEDFMSTKTKTQQRGQARVQLPERHQTELRTKSLDQMVLRDHLARQVVSFVDSLDLCELYSDIRAMKDNVGRASIDTRILFCLWLYATLEGETSGRRIRDSDGTRRDL